MQDTGKKNLYIGVSLAVVAAVLWSGNFVIARGFSTKIPPFTINFFRWSSAATLLFPFIIKPLWAEKGIIYKNWKYFFAVSVSCILLFNSFIYIAGHHTSAINMALIGTTTTPIITIVLAVIFFKEKLKPLRIVGLIICIAGILTLLSNGSVSVLMAFRFSQGDWWVLVGAFFFAVYTLLVKKKPAGISSLVFLFVFFFLGAAMLLPFYLWEHSYSEPISWNGQLVSIVAYLGIGTSLISYLCWNAAILRIGPSRTALFGNLIPIFSSFEAVMWLGEKIEYIHLISGVLVITGLVVANMRKSNAF